jgi:hypothetical protein
MLSNDQNGLKNVINDRKRSGTVRNGQERSGTVNGQERSGTENGQERSYCTRSRSETFKKSRSLYGHGTVTVRSRYGHGHASKLKETL